MTKTDDDENESCDYTDYETDGFWSSEKTLLESVRNDDAKTTTTRRKKKTKKKKKYVDDQRDDKKDAASTGLKQQWRSFLQEHDEEWRDFWRVGRRCFVDTVRT